MLKNQILIIDASNIYILQATQNVLEEKDVEEIFNIYCKFESVEEKAALVTIDDIRSEDYELLTKFYVKKKKEKTITLQEAKKNFQKAMEDVFAAEDKFDRMLKKGGYVNE